MTKNSACFHLIFMIFLWHFVQPAHSAYQIKGIRYWSAPDHTRVVLDINDKMDYRYFTLTHPHRFVVDFKNTTTSFVHDSIPVNDAVIKEIRFGQFKKDVLRIVFDLVQPAEPKLFFPERLRGKSPRLVIELRRLEQKKQTKENHINLPPRDKKIVVIDPGHGGEDPGAIGPGGTMEKEVVLEFARSLKKVFDEKEDYQAFLTRNADYFLPLRERIRIAEEYGADLFISIHADSNRAKKMRGTSVYCLSLKGASDEAARCLAEKENASDLIGGIPFTENDDLNFTLLDLALTNTINSSLRFGALVLKEVKKVHPVKFEKPKQAGFKVLKAPEIPSVLIELGFLSNPTEERVLKQKRFQEKVARAIFSASEQFFDYLAKKTLDSLPSDCSKNLRGSYSPIKNFPLPE